VRKRKERDAERLMSSWRSRSPPGELELGRVEWMGYGIASLEPARPASSRCSLRPRATHILSHLSHSAMNCPHISPRFGNFIFSNNSIPLAKRLNRSHVIRSLIVTGSHEKITFLFTQITQIGLASACPPPLSSNDQRILAVRGPALISLAFRFPFTAR